MKIQNNKLYYAMALFLLGLIIIHIGILYYSGSFIKGFRMIFNSDNLYLPALYHDIVQGNGNISDWYLTPAPYFFPDMLLYFISNSIIDNIFHAIFFFIILQLLIVYFFLNKLFSILFSSGNSLLYSAISVGLVYTIPNLMTKFVFLSGYHFGGILIGLVLLYLVLKIIILEKEKKTIYYSIYILTVFMVLSDKLFIIQFLIPTILTFVLLWLLKYISYLRVVKISFIIVLGAITGIILYFILISHPINLNISFGLSEFNNNLKQFKKIIVQVFKSNPYVVVFVALQYIALVFVTIKNMTGNRIKLKHFYINVFIIIMALTTSFVLMLSTASIDKRYFLPLYFLPLMFYPLLFESHVLIKRFRYLGIILLYLAMLIYIIYSSYKTIRNNKFITDYYPKYIQCFDDFIEKTAAQVGVSGYWQASRFTQLSKYNIKINSVTNKLQPYNWISPEINLQMKNYFAIIRNNKNIKSQPDLNLISQKPTDFYSCGRYTIYYYEPGFNIFSIKRVKQ